MGGGKSESESESFQKSNASGTSTDQSKFGSNTGSITGSNFDQNVWGGQSPALQDLYAQAGNLFGQTNQGMQSQIPGAVQGMQNVADQANPAWQQQMQGGAYKDMGLQDQLMGSLNQSMNQPSAMTDINAMIMGGEGNNYADAMKQQYMNDAGLAQQNMMSNMDARAVAAGQSGSSRHGIAQAQGMQDINKNLQSNLAQTGFSTFDKDLDRKLQIAQQADQGTLARQQMMGNMIGQQQGAMDQGLQGAQNQQNLGMGTFAPYMMPWQAQDAYSQSVGGPTLLSGGSEYGGSFGNQQASSNATNDWNSSSTGQADSDSKGFGFGF